MDLGYMRWDYVTLWFDMEPDRFHQHLQQIEQIAERLPECAEWKTESKVSVFRSTTEGRRCYAINVRGRSTRVVQYLPVSYHQYVRRLDIKSWPEDFVLADLLELRRQLLDTKCGYNVTTHTGKVRQKNDKRDAGGTSLSIGSHKSDLRVSFYARGFERACVEFQVSGDMLRRVLNDVACSPENRFDAVTFWACVKDRLQQLGVCRVNRAMDNAGLSRWRPTTPEEREAAALDQLAAQQDAAMLDLHAQQEMDLAADQPTDQRD